MTPTQQRDRVSDLAPTAPTAALEKARRIDAPWFRGQALAWVGRYWPHRDFTVILQDSADTLRLKEDAYCFAAGAAWPIRAWLERGASAEAARVLDEALGVAQSLPHAGSRAEALMLLFQATRPFDEALWGAAFSRLATPSPHWPTDHWRRTRNLNDALKMLGSGDLAALRASGTPEAVCLLVDGQDGPVLAPRPFFWTHA